MQLICEAYHLMKDGLDLSHDQMVDILTQWNKSELNSFLIEIIRDILKYKDS
jgi:6-phosphogluconate dehydrogenase